MHQFHSEQNKLFCKLKGRYDTPESLQFDTDLSNTIQAHHQEVVFDLKETEYISSTFLRICIKMVQQLGTGNFSVTRVNPTILKVFKIANLAEICSVE